MEEKEYNIPIRHYAATPKRRISKRRRRQIIRARILICVLCALLIGMIVLLVIFISSLFKKPENASLIGIWIYEEDIHYTFNEDNSGCLGSEEYDYEYTYTVTENTVSLDFEDEALTDCTYTFKIKGNTLTLIGGDGTAGGEYELIKQP